MDNEQLLEQNNKMRDEWLEQQSILLKKNTQWLHFLATTISIILGVLVSFGRPDGLTLHSIFLVEGVVLLTISLIIIVLCIYGDKEFTKSGMDEIRKEALKASEERRKANLVILHEKKVFKVLEVIGCVLFCLALICLCVYMILCLNINQ